MKGRAETQEAVVTASTHEVPAPGQLMCHSNMGQTWLPLKPYSQVQIQTVLLTIWSPREHPFLITKQSLASREQRQIPRGTPV